MISSKTFVVNCGELFKGDPMTCKREDIKELLPAYGEQALDEAERLRVGRHLGTCGECRAELTLLRLMKEERVPDPGQAFWAAMPGRVYGSLQREKLKGKRLAITDLWERMILPRWAWAAAAAGIVLAVAWLASTPQLWQAHCTCSVCQERCVSHVLQEPSSAHCIAEVAAAC